MVRNHITDLSRVYTNGSEHDKISPCRCDSTQINIIQIMTQLRYRTIRFFLVLISFSVLFFSLYAQYGWGLQPCPLCLMQRWCVFLLLMVLGVSLGTLRKAHLLSFLQIVISCAGLFFSLRQVWLQSLPAGSVPACMPGLDILIHYFPWQQTAKALLWGSGDCAEHTWSLLGLSMPGWSALYFFLIALSSALLWWRTRL